MYWSGWICISKFKMPRQESSVSHIQEKCVIASYNLISTLFSCDLLKSKAASMNILVNNNSTEHTYSSHNLFASIFARKAMQIIIEIIIIWFLFPLATTHGAVLHTLLVLHLCDLLENKRRKKSSETSVKINSSEMKYSVECRIGKVPKLIHSLPHWHQLQFRRTITFLMICFEFVNILSKSTLNSPFDRSMNSR